MIQVGLSGEVRFRDYLVTLALGWGVGTFSNMPWYRNLFGIIRQGALGIVRYGVIFCGFFVSIQCANTLTLQRGWSVPKQKKRPVARPR